MFSFAFLRITKIPLMHNYFILSDEELFDLIKNEDELAFSELYNRYKRPMIGLALKKLDDEEVVEDIVHDLFVKFWINRAAIQITNFKSYIYRALRNKVLDYIAHLVHERKYLDSLVDYEKEYAQGSDFTIREEQFLQELDKLMIHYSPQDNMILKMRMQGYSNTEIAEHLGLSEKTVRNKYSLITKALSGKLKILTIFCFF